MLITRDPHDIALRLKEIDPSYELHFNNRTSRFELKDGSGATLIVFPYDRMDERMVRHARRTRAERLAEIIHEIDLANERAEKRALRIRENAAEDGLREAADRFYADRKRKGAG